MLSKSDLRIFLNSRRYNDIFIDPNNSPQKLCISQTMLIRFKPNQVGFNSQLVFKPNQTWLNCSLASTKLNRLHFFLDLNQTKTVTITNLFYTNHSRLKSRGTITHGYFVNRRENWSTKALH